MNLLPPLFPTFLALSQSLIFGESRLPHSKPETQGVPSGAIQAFVEAADREIDSIHSFVLVRNGHRVAEAWWAPFSREQPHRLFSLSKSFASTAVGMAIDEGILSLDDSVLSFFPEDAPKEPSYNLKAMRVRDLLSMSTGHVQEDLKNFSFGEKEGGDALTKAFLALPVKHKPGTHFLYNTPATYMCSAILQKKTGKTLMQYLDPRLFKPLGIEGASWQSCSRGINLGGFGLKVRTEDIARFGQLYLQKGQWKGKRLLSSSWVEQATSRQTSNGSNPESDWEQGYGYQFWRCRHNAYRGDGAFGQFCIVLPQQNAVLAVTSGTSKMGKIMSLAWEHLLPAMEEEAIPENPDAQKRLEGRLASLRLPPIEKIASATDESKGGLFELEENPYGLRQFEMEKADGGMWVHFREDEKTYSIQATPGEWAEGHTKLLGLLNPRSKKEEQPYAASGSWANTNTYQLRIWFTETPFSILLNVVFQDDGKKAEIQGEHHVAFGPRKLHPLKATKAETP